MKHLSLGLRVGLAMAFCAALLAPGALADNGKKPPGDRPGNSANAPGHEKQDAAAPPQPAAPEPPPLPPSAAASADAAPESAHAKPVEAKEADPAAPAVTAQPAKPTKPENDRRAKPEKQAKSEAQPRPGGSPRPPEAGERSRATTAHSKVLICHATGSATNPYVLISVSVNAWSKGSGHGAHADDVFVDWSWPGDPRQKNDALCAASGPVAPTSTSTGTTTSSSSAPPTADEPGNDPGKAPTSSPAADREVPGPTSALPAAKAVETPSRSVLTGVRSGHAVVRGTLPFTGLPLWGIALVGLGLVALGLVLHRRTERRPATSRARRNPIGR